MASSSDNIKGRDRLVCFGLAVLGIGGALSSVVWANTLSAEPHRPAAICAYPDSVSVQPSMVVRDDAFRPKNGFCNINYVIDPFTTNPDYRVSTSKVVLVSVLYVLGDPPSSRLTVWSIQRQLRIRSNKVRCPSGKDVEANPIAFTIFFLSDGSAVCKRCLGQLANPAVSQTPWFAGVIPVRTTMQGALCSVD